QILSSLACHHPSRRLNSAKASSSSRGLPARTVTHTHACWGCVSVGATVAGGSWMSVPPDPSVDMAKLAAVYWPNNPRLAVFVPSLTVKVPPVLLLLAT